MFYDYAGLIPIRSLEDVNNIKFSDFQGSIPEGQQYIHMDAEVRWIPYYNFMSGKITKKGGAECDECCISMPNAYIELRFQEDKSWYRGNLTPEQEAWLIRHERVHIEMARRVHEQAQAKLRKLEKCGGCKKEVLVQLIDALIKEGKEVVKEAEIEAQRQSNEYDRETLHSTNRDRQMEYNEQYGL